MSDKNGTQRMLENDLKEISENLKDSKRFLSITGEKSTYYYDSYTQSLYNVNSKIMDQILNKKDFDIDELKRLNIEDCTKILNFFSTVYKNKTDHVMNLPPETKCTVMINTSNRCNLNCSYCYRNKDEPSVNSLEMIKKSIDFAMNHYKPDADEFVFSYSMTSESSVDLPLLRQVANEYINYENYKFNDEDINEYSFDEFYERLKNDFQNMENLEQNFPNKDKNEIVSFLNSLLEIKDLFNILRLSESMFNDNDRNEIRRRYFLSKWRLYRVNRWCLEVLYDRYILKRHIPFVSFWFMTNGTCADEAFIDFIKSVDINPLWISIDGPKKVHDYNRKFINGNGSYDKIIKNLQIFHQHGINIKASVVITAYYPKPLEIVRHCMELGFYEISMTPIRPGYEVSFNEENVDMLLNGYDELFEEFENEAIRENFILFKILKEDFSLAALNIFIGRTKLIKRCNFDDQLVIDSKGDLYPCLYFTGNKDFCLGNIESGLDRRKLEHNILVNKRGECIECWARYLCGGTCFYGSYVSQGNDLDIDPIECSIKKHLAKKCLELIVFLREHNISISQIYN